MFGPGFGRNSLSTAYARAIEAGFYDPFEDYETEFRNARAYLTLGKQNYLPMNHLPPNDSWWIGDWHSDKGVMLQREMSGGIPLSFAAPDPEMNFVLTHNGPYSAIVNARGGYHQPIVNPRNFFVMGDVPPEAQQGISEDPYYMYGGFSGGWH